MDIIRQNPFRVLGVACNASERELQKQIAIIKRYAEIGKTKSFDYDIEILGELNRALDKIQQASNQIEQSHNRLFYSLFWFINHNQFDEIALNYLNGNNPDKAIEIWRKVLKDKVTSKNFTSYHNLSTLYIALSCSDQRLDKDMLRKGIFLKCTLVHSDSFQYLSELVTGTNISLNSYELSSKFIDEIIDLLTPYLNESTGMSTRELISFFSTSPHRVQKYVTSKFTELPVSNVTNLINKTIEKRKNNPSKAGKYGETLYVLTKKDISLLKNIMGSASIQYQIIADKLANEILQCSIDFFNKWREVDGEFDPGEDALKLAKYARSIAATTQVRDRINENIPLIQEWVDDAPSRARLKNIIDDLNFIAGRLKNFQDLSPSIEEAKRLVRLCRPKLANIKIELGEHDDYYLQVSSAVSNNALGMLISIVNEAQSNLADNHAKLSLLPGIISSAVSAMSSIESLDMDYETRKRFNENKQTINNINRSLQSASNRRTSSGGCYIATMAYGDYEHPQVMILRKFRDEKLVNWFWGRGFIQLYYAISPHLVNHLAGHDCINRTIRNILDKIILRVKQ